MRSAAFFALGFLAAAAVTVAVDWWLNGDDYHREARP